MTKQVKIHVAIGFRHLPDAGLLALSMGVQSGMTGNPNFPSAPVDLAALKTANENFSAAITLASDGSRKAIAEKNKQREALIKILRQLSTYVEANVKEDLSILTSSGFQAAAPKGRAQTLSPNIRGIDQGLSGQLSVRLVSIKGARSYEVRYATIANANAGTWTTIAAGVAKTPVTINSLTPGTTYAFQVRTLSATEYSDWSDTITKMST